MKSSLNHLQSIINAHEEQRKTIKSIGLAIYDSRRSSISLPDPNKMYFYLVVSGGVRIYTPAGIMDYFAGQYSIPQIDMPEKGEKLTDSTNLIMRVWNFSSEDVFSVVRKLDQSVINSIIFRELSTETIHSSTINIIKLMSRLLEIADGYPQIEFLVEQFILVEQFKREVIFYLLMVKKEGSYCRALTK